MTAPDRSRAVPLVVIIVSSTVAVSGLTPTIAGWAFMTSAVVGVVGAFVIGMTTRRHELLLGESIACSILGFLLLGGVATAGVPSPNAYLRFVDGLINGWSDFLSSTAPVDLTDQFRVLPFTIAWWSIVIGIETLRRTKQPLAALSGPLMGLTATLLLSVGDPLNAKLQGLTMTAAVLTLLGQRPANDGALESDAPTSHPALGTPLGRLAAVSLLVLIVGAAPLIGPRLPLATTNDRFDLRRLQDRPWSPLDQPSPLATLKASLKEPRINDVVFTVHSDSPINRWSLAVLGNYNGVVWAVADESVDAAAQFEPVDSNLPAGPETNLGPVVEYQLEIGDLGGVWVPVAGWPDRAASERPLHMNVATGTLASRSGLAPGSILRMSSFPRTELPASEFHGSTVPTSDESTTLALLPPRIRNLAGDVFEGVEAGSARVAALNTRFAANGFYDAGPSARPGHSLARIDEFLADPDRLVGFEEQYAASAALLLRAAGVPSRVVVGYVIPDTRYDDGAADVRAGDISAWVELLTIEHGWVPVTVSPDRTRVPEEQATGGFIEQIVIPNPPIPAQPPTDLTQPTNGAGDVGVDEDDPIDETRAALGSVPAPVVATGVALGVPLSTIALAASLVVGLKRRRRRHRRYTGRSDHQVAGAWRELVDRYHELGVVTSGSTTPSEAIEAFKVAIPVSSDAELELIELAELLDRSAFHPTAPGAEQATAAWASTDRIVRHLHAGLSRWHRIVAVTDPRPLLKADRYRSSAGPLPVGDSNQPSGRKIATT